MIIFDGVDIKSVAGVLIEDIRVSPVELNPVSRPRAIVDGSNFVRNRCGTRTVAITFALLSEDRNARQAALMAISAWAKTDAEYKLELPGYPNHYLMAVCTGKPEPSMRQWWEAKLRLVFTCFENPFWNDRMEKSVSCGTAVLIQGSAPPLMKITRTLSSQASNQTYTFTKVGDNASTIMESMTFTKIPAGSMIIDLNKQTAEVGGNSFMGQYQATSRFLIPRAGKIMINGTGTVVYRERWQ